MKNITLNFVLHSVSCLLLCQANHEKLRNKDLNIRNSELSSILGWIKVQREKESGVGTLQLYTVPRYAGKASSDIFSLLKHL